MITSIAMVCLTAVFVVYRLTGGDGNAFLMTLAALSAGGGFAGGIYTAKKYSKKLEEIE